MALLSGGPSDLDYANTRIVASDVRTHIPVSPHMPALHPPHISPNGLEHDPYWIDHPMRLTKKNLRNDVFVWNNVLLQSKSMAMINNTEDVLRQLGKSLEDDGPLLFSIPGHGLAPEWTDFFQAVQEQYLMMVPQDVQAAFRNEVAPLDSSTGTVPEHAVSPTEDALPLIPEPPRAGTKRKTSGPTNDADVSETKPNETATIVPNKRARISKPSALQKSPQNTRSKSKSALAKKKTDVSLLTPSVETTSGGDHVQTPDIPPTSTSQPALSLPIHSNSTMAPQTARDPIAEYMARDPARASVHVQGQGRSLVAHSRGMIRAQIEIENKTFDQLHHSTNSTLYHEIRSVATPRAVDPLLLNFVTTAQEMLTFLPYATVNIELWDRLRASWTGNRIMDFMHHVSQLNIETSYHRTYFQHQRDIKQNEQPVPTATFTTNVPSSMSPRNTLRRNEKAHDYFLYHLGDGVIHYPQGRNVQLLTRCIWHARNVSHDKWTRMSEVLQYAAKHNITIPANELIQPDTNVVQEDTPSRAFLDMIDREFFQRHGKHSGTVR